METGPPPKADPPSVPPASPKKIASEPDPTDPPQLAEEIDGGGERTALRGDARFGEGRVEGRVTFGGDVPPPEPIDMSADPKCRELTASVRSAEFSAVRRPIVVDDEGGLDGAIVWVAIDGDYPPPDEPVELHQKSCQFVPDTIAIQVGQRFAIFNDDPLLHNIHAIAKRSEFNQAMPKQGTRIEKVFKTVDLEGALRCDIHPWMRGMLSVFSHPFFAVTDAHGKFVIEHLPGEGPYHVFARHPVAGSRELVVRSGTIELAL